MGAYNRYLGIIGTDPNPPISHPPLTHRYYPIKRDYRKPIKVLLSFSVVVHHIIWLLFLLLLCYCCGVVVFVFVCVCVFFCVEGRFILVLFKKVGWDL